MNDYCLIPLTQGQFAKVSPEDFYELSAFKWHALVLTLVVVAVIIVAYIFLFSRWL